MTLIQERLINAYTTLVLAERKDILEVPETSITIIKNIEGVDTETQSTMRAEVEIKVAKRQLKL